MGAFRNLLEEKWAKSFSALSAFARAEGSTCLLACLPARLCSAARSSGACCALRLPCCPLLPLPLLCVLALFRVCGSQSRCACCGGVRHPCSALGTGSKLLFDSKWLSHLMSATPTQLALLSAVGSSAVTSVGWGFVSPLVTEWAPWCKAAASLLDQFTAAKGQHFEAPCACELKPELEQQIAQAVQEAVLGEHEEYTHL